MSTSCSRSLPAPPPPSHPLHHRPPAASHAVRGAGRKQAGRLALRRHNGGDRSLRSCGQRQHAASGGHWMLAGRARRAYHRGSILPYSSTLRALCDNLGAAVAPPRPAHEKSRPASHAATCAIAVLPDSSSFRATAAADVGSVTCMQFSQFTLAPRTLHWPPIRQGCINPCGDTMREIIRSFPSFPTSPPHDPPYTPASTSLPRYPTHPTCNCLPCRSTHPALPQPT